MKRQILIGIGLALLIVSAIIIANVLTNPQEQETENGLYRVGSPDSPTNSDYTQTAPSFTLTNQHGEEVSLSDYRGKVVVVSFIYLDCQTTCPLIVGKLRKVREKLGDRMDRDVVFLTIDFDLEDQPSDLRTYAEEQDMKGRNGSWILLTGDKDEVNQVMDEFGAVAAKTGEEDGRSTFEHNVVISIVDRNGVIRKEYRGATFYKPERIANKTIEIAKMD